jgi:hypothetical protein
MTKQGDRGASQIVIESTLTRPMYAWILLLLGIRSWIFVILSVVFIYLLWMSITSGSYHSLLVIYAALMVAIYAGAILFSVMSRKTRKAYIPVKYTFNESVVVKQTAATSQVLKWSMFVRWRKVGAYYLIYMTKRSFFVIPKAKIPEGKESAFENLLSRSIIKKRSRLR